MTSTMVPTPRRRRQAGLTVNLTVAAGLMFGVMAPDMANRPGACEEF